MRPKVLLTIVLGSAVVLVGSTVLLTIAPDRVREGADAAATLIAALGTAAAAVFSAVAAFAARKSATESSAAAVTASRALAMHHRRTFVNVVLMPENGVDGNEWYWHCWVSLLENTHQRELVRDVVFEWTVGGTAVP